MGRSEPSLVPEWLRSNGSGGLSHHFVSQAGWISSTGYLKSSRSNGLSNKHVKNPYSRSYSASMRNQLVNDREKSLPSGSWDFEYSGLLASYAGRKLQKGSLEHSQSMISGRAMEFSQRRNLTDLRNRSRGTNGAISAATVSTVSPKVSLERDFPLLGSDDRPTMSGVVRAPSPGQSKDLKDLSIGTSSLIGNEEMTSALADRHVGVAGSDKAESSFGSQPIHAAAGLSSPVSSSTSSAAASNGFNMTESVVHPPAESNNIQQQSVHILRSDELPVVGTKKLIAMTPSMPKISVLNPSDKLKPITPARSNNGVAGPRNGLQRTASLQLGSQGVRGGSTLADSLKSSSGMLLLKTGRASPVLKDALNQTIKTSGAVANGPPGVASCASVPFKISYNMKRFNSERKASAHNSKSVPLLDKQLASAQLRSRYDFFNVLRNKSVGSTCATTDSGSAVSCDTQSSGERNLVACAKLSTTENDGEVECNGDICNLTESCSDQRESASSHFEIVHSDEEELDFLRGLGWEDYAGEDEGLTEEEINAFFQKYMKREPDSKLLRGLQLKMTVGSDSQGLCSTNA